MHTADENVLGGDLLNKLGHPFYGIALKCGEADMAALVFYGAFQLQTALFVDGHHCAHFAVHTGKGRLDNGAAFV